MISISSWVAIVVLAVSGLLLLFTLWKKSLKKQVREGATEQKAGNKLLESVIAERNQPDGEARLTSEILTSIREGVYLIKAEGEVIIFTNPAFEKMFGYEPGEMLGKHVSILNAPTDKSPEDTATEIIAELNTSGQWKGEIHNIKKDGTPFWCHAHVSFFEHPEYGLVWATVHTDITERKRTEELLASSETKYRDLIDNSLVGVFNTNLAGEFIFVNDALAQMYDFDSIEQMLAMGSLPRWVNIEERERMLSLLKEHGRVDNFEAETVTFTGRHIHVLFSARLHDEDITGMVMDITARKNTEQSLKESEELFRMIYEHAPVMIDAFDDNGRCTMWNKECENVFGWTAEEIFSHNNPLELFYPDPETQKQVIDSTTSNPEKVFREWKPKSKNGFERVCLWANFALPDGRIINIGYDITEQKLSEIKIQQYQKKLKSLTVQLTLAEEQERRRIAEDLHDDVGQSLALTRMQLVTARKGLPMDSKQDELFEEMSNSLLKAVQNIRHLIFELSSPSLNELGLAAAISEWMDENVTKKNGLQVELFDHAQDFLLDVDLRAILFRNVRELLTNVIKHARAKIISVWLESTEDGLEITIQDDGVGFDASAAWQSDIKAGFGLFSIQERMTNLGGKLTIGSQPGAGCKAVLFLPRQQEREV